MSVRQIVYSDNPVLRERSRRVRRVTPAVEQLVEDMLETMRAANGIGLAAVQIGVPQRIIVIEIPVAPDDEEDETDSPSDEPRPVEQTIIINPEVRRRSRDLEEGIEGCLSVPGWVGEVPRHRTVTVTGLDLQGRPVKVKAEGLFARVLQHEIDHCSGVLFIDHIEDPEKIWPVAEGEEEAAEAAQEVPDRAPPTEI